MVPYLPSQVIIFCKISSIFLHVLFRVVLGIPFLKTETSIAIFLSISFHDSLWNYLFLNQRSPCFEIFVASAKNDSIIVNLMSPISTSVPSKDLENNLVISLWKPSKFSIKFNHPACCINSLTCRYPSMYLTSTGYVQTIRPILLLCRVSLSSELPLCVWKWIGCRVWWRWMSDGNEIAMGKNEMSYESDGGFMVSCRE